LRRNFGFFQDSFATSELAQAQNRSTVHRADDGPFKGMGYVGLVNRK
jgi:hypothetical protein